MIQIDISKCTGCRMCETACAMYHTGRVNRHMARINVINIYHLGIDGPVICLQCDEKYCMNCPSNAITLGSQGQVIISPTLCTLCGKCEKECPIGAVKLFRKFVYVCDLCGGSPKCVEACTEGALSYSDDQNVSLAKFKEEVKKMNTSEKRVHYIMNQGNILRNKWRR